MRRKLLILLLALGLAGAAQAGDDDPACSGLRAWWCRWTAHLRTEPGPCGTWPMNPSEHTDTRAGCPREVSPLAQPSNGAHDMGGYVGGGSASVRRGDPRTPEEGTWGWDYRLSSLVRDPFLEWWHGRRYQGGTGAYKTDGPCSPEPPPIYKTPGESPHDH
jgi:hypothetical protein